MNPIMSEKKLKLSCIAAALTIAGCLSVGCAERSSKHWAQISPLVSPTDDSAPLDANLSAHSEILMEMPNDSESGIAD